MLGPNGTPKEKELAENTLLFAAEHTELGVFPFGWIAAAAARMGMGNMARRVLYEQGLDIILRANGMGAEETDRWINHCAIDSANLYYPFMMECVGEIINCINEMLMQSYDGTIRVFPAIPNGSKETCRSAGRQKHPAAPWPEPVPEHWKDCNFVKLLAKGGFEVSASMANGQVDRISIHSLRGGLVRLALPDSLAGFTVLDGDGTICPAKHKEGCLTFATKPGQTYEIGLPSVKRQSRSDHTVNEYTTHLGRRNFIGKHQNTDTIKLMDSFLHDYYVGNDRYHPIVAWRFNFGQDLDSMVDKAGSLKSTKAQSESDLKFIRVTPRRKFSTYYGYGFADTAALCAQAEQNTNYLLQDYVEGREKNRFLLELPKGRYDILVVSGGRDATQTCIKLGSAAATLNAVPGEYRAEVLPVVQKADGIVELLLHPGKSGCWRLNFLIIRKLATYM